MLTTVGFVSSWLDSTMEAGQSGSRTLIGTDSMELNDRF